MKNGSFRDEDVFMWMCNQSNIFRECIFETWVLKGALKGHKEVCLLRLPRETHRIYDIERHKGKLTVVVMM